MSTDCLSGITSRFYFLFFSNHSLYSMLAVNPKRDVHALEQMIGEGTLLE